MFEKNSKERIDAVMYMVTKGNSGVPLIKLSEGSSVNPDKGNYVTVVCGSNGEKLKPIKVWDKPFVFFNKENLNAEFVSRNELVYIKVTDKNDSWFIDIIRYKLPNYLINNSGIDYSVVRKTKPLTETLLHVDLRKQSSFVALEDFLRTMANGVFKDAVVKALYKIEHKNIICFAEGVNK